MKLDIPLKMASKRTTRRHTRHNRSTRSDSATSESSYAHSHDEGETDETKYVSWRVVGNGVLCKRLINGLYITLYGHIWHIDIGIGVYKMYSNPIIRINVSIAISIAISIALSTALSTAISTAISTAHTHTTTRQH